MFSSAVSRNDMSLIDILQDLTDNVNKGTKNILCDTEIFSLTFSHFISSAYSFSGSSGDFSRSSLTYQIILPQEEPHEVAVLSGDERKNLSSR